MIISCTLFSRHNLALGLSACPSTHRPHPYLQADCYRLHLQSSVYMVTLVVSNLGWADINFHIPPSCLVTKPFQPNSYQPSHIWANRGTFKIKANPTQVQDQQCHPVHGLLFMASVALARQRIEHGEKLHPVYIAQNLL